MDAASPFRYLSVCSGIEAATVAWQPLGWHAAAFSEIDPFARAVLAHHYPQVPLHGDFTALGENDYGAIDLLVGGTPCQSFSIAGLRRGLDDDRGNLALEYIRLAERSRPRWLVWENVPGVLSIDKGRAFGSFLGGLAECGYGFAYRILDAQYFGVPQRRRRVFVIGYLGDWRPAAAVLFERESLRGDITPRRETRQDTAGTLGARTCRSIGAQDAECGHLIAKTLMGCGAKHDAELETYVLDTLTSNGDAHSGYRDEKGLIAQKWPADVACTLNAQYGDKMGLEDQHALAGAPLFVPARAYNITFCDANGRRKDRANGGMYVNETDQAKTVTAGGDLSTYIEENDLAVRRLTPRECERLQGFADDYTLIPYRGRQAADGPRYKVLGNSMPVVVMRWLGKRIQMINNSRTISGR